MAVVGHPSIGSAHLGARFAIPELSNGGAQVPDLNRWVPRLTLLVAGVHALTAVDQ